MARMSVYPRSLVMGCGLILSACQSLPPPAPTAKMDFVVVGDTPYNASDEAMLAKALPRIMAINPPFVIHVGDIQGGGELCGPPDARFEKLKSDLGSTPLIYTPGDNEWTDCDRKTDPSTGKLFSELNRLKGLRSQFFSRPALNDPALRYVQQAGQPENARFQYKGLVFVTLHVVGTNNGYDSVMGDPLEAATSAAKARDAANTRWIADAFGYARRHRAQGVVIAMQADMSNRKPETIGVLCQAAIVDEARDCDGFLPVRQALSKEVGRFKGFVLLIHGDTAPFTLRAGIPFADTGKSRVYTLNAAGDAGIDKDSKPYGVADVTHVWLDLNAQTPVRAEGITTGAVPEN